MLHYNQSLKRTYRPDLEKERCEKVLSIEEFVSAYNEDLPEAFPRVTLPLLTEFREAYPSLFKNKQKWTLGQHRKKVMDWLPQHIEPM